MTFSSVSLKACVAAVFLVSSVTVQAQELWMPRNIAKAYNQQTRSIDGKPGARYWQNGGDYTIHFNVDVRTKTISGKETIMYSNNSPDDLKTLVIRFVNNLHKPTSPRNAKAATDFLSAGLNLKLLKINGKTYKVNSADWETFHEVKLDQPLAAGATHKIEMEWSYPLSKQSGREGQIDETTFFCAYAYPRISVYDDYNGWDKLPHMGRGEFYNNFNNYEVAITAPKNYVVYATGIFQNPNEVLQPAIAQRFEKSLNSDEVIHVATAADMKAKRVTKQNARNTWKFTAQNVPDFTFAVSSSYIWDAASVQLDSKRVSTQSTYKAGTPDFEKYVEWEQYSIKWFSENWPGIEYPYPTMTGFQGFADMEYPMMINDTSVPDDFADARQTVDHEIAHTYFPFMMGTNESRYAFMDEGWVTAFEYLIGEAENGKEFNDKAFTDFRVKKYIYDPSAEQDQPLISMTSQLTGMGYSSNAYIKPAFAYLALKHLLGDQKFKQTLHYYMNTWAGKHPTPWDFFYSFNTGSGQNLNWFWKNWFFSTHYIDLKLTSAVQENNLVKFTVRNAGGFAIPFTVIYEYTDGTSSQQKFTPGVWETQQYFSGEYSTDKKVKAVKIDNGIFFDYTPENNLLQL